jgi:hypothetical protein
MVAGFIFRAVAISILQTLPERGGVPAENWESLVEYLRRRPATQLMPVLMKIRYRSGKIPTDVLARCDNSDKSRTRGAENSVDKNRISNKKRPENLCR